jgi:protein disulfide-isomerase A6
MIALFFFFALAFASDVVVLDESNFDTIVNGDKHVFVEFFAPWCGHCKSLAPEYELAATAFKGTSDVVIASVDADQHKSLGGRFGVQGFPTLKFFPKGGDVKKPEDYNGGRTADAIVTFVNEKAGSRARVKKASSPVVVLDNSNFDKVVDGSKHVLAEFYAPWCGHCKSLAPKYDQLAKLYAGESDVVIAKIDADSAAGRPLGERFEVKGFPTLKWFPKGSTKPEAYESGREVADFVTFINNKAGTAVSASGGVLPTAGRIAALDALAKELVSKSKKSVQAEIKAASAALKGAEKEAADFYHIIAQKFETEGASFIAKQKLRISGLLQNKDSMTAQKAAELAKKLNILAAFE